MPDAIYQYPSKPGVLDRRQGDRRRDFRPWLLLLSALIILVDHLTKKYVVAHLPAGATHILNTGAAFSVFSDSTSPETVRKGLIAFSIVAVLIVLAMLWRAGRALSLSSVALALILGGAIGNLYDRIRYHFVIDFIEVHIVHYHWPDFNVADSAIVVGACLLILEIFRPHSDHIDDRRSDTDRRSGRRSIETQ
jgi:signal peptidase II